MGALNLVAPQGWLYVQQLAGADISPLDGNSGFDPTRTWPASFAVLHNDPDDALDLAKQ